MGAPQFEQAGADISGTGTTNTIPRWTGPSTLGDSILTQSGTTIYQTGSVNGAVAFNVTNQNTGASAYSAVEIDSAGASWRLKSIRTAGMFAIERNGVVAVQIDNVLNVGIGTASPNGKFEVFGSVSSTASIRATSHLAGNRSIRMFADTVCLVETTTDDDLWLRRNSVLIGKLVANGVEISGTNRLAIGTSSFTTGRALTTVADLDVFGVRVGRGGDGSQTSNTALGRSALGSITTGDSCTAVGSLALQSVTGSRNTAVGYAALGAIGASTDNTALGASAIGNNTGSRNTAVGRNALNGSAGASTGSDNVCIGERAGDSITTGASNIVIGSNADLAAATDSNQLVLGDATNYVATNGGATTYYATAGASLGYMRVRLNGTYVKIEVFADV